MKYHLFHIPFIIVLSTVVSFFLLKTIWLYYAPSHGGIMFKDRYDAAEKLVPFLEKYKANLNALILAIPRGGLQIGYVLANKLHIPLDVIFTKKLTLPENPEYAIGAVSEAQVFLDSNFKNMAHTHGYILEEVKRLQATIKERMKQYRKDMPPLLLQGKTVIVADDGSATGNTLLMTLEMIKGQRPQKIIVALPVASVEALKKLQNHADEIVYYAAPELFMSVGQFYENFEQVDDKNAIELLKEANRIRSQ